MQVLVLAALYEYLGVAGGGCLQQLVTLSHSLALPRELESRKGSDLIKCLRSQPLLELKLNGEAVHWPHA